MASLKDNVFINSGYSAWKKGTNTQIGLKSLDFKQEYTVDMKKYQDLYRNTCKPLMAKEPKEKTMESSYIVEELKFAELPEDEQLLIKHGLKNNKGIWQRSAHELALDVLCDEKHDEIVARVKKYEEARKKRDN